MLQRREDEKHLETQASRLRKRNVTVYNATQTRRAAVYDDDGPVLVDMNWSRSLSANSSWDAGFSDSEPAVCVNNTDTASHHAMLSEQLLKL